MDSYPIKPDNEFYHKLKWLIFFRLLFATLLLGSSLVLQMSEKISMTHQPLLLLYGLIAMIFFLSFCYALLLYRTLYPVWFAYIQISIDTFLVSLIIFLTGSYASLFSFLYLVVIIYTSIILFRNGSMIMAALCGIQYGVMVDLEFYGILSPFGAYESIAIHPWSHILYKVMIIMVACFAVAFLSGVLAEQTKNTRRELDAMEAHVRRVEKLAAVGEMAAGLAHEIKNPLASLRGAVQMLNEDLPYDPDKERLMSIILREADRLGGLVSDFLLFAKPPAAKIETVYPDKVLEETLALFQNDKKYRENIQIVRNFCSGIKVNMDPFHLHQIFWNLLLNAAEAITGQGKITLSISPLKNKFVAVSISDTGCGMSEELSKTIFNPFVSTKSGGTGLGLSIVQRIADAYDCRLYVESEVGKGSNIYAQTETGRISGI
ncbi:MAG: GHKL domain-containing protein [Desulfobacteraceae bacterium]|nr:GHKL domain-containing protein [Desulfobacteraceae bacterium]